MEFNRDGVSFRGPYPNWKIPVGILFFQDREVPDGTVHVLNSNSGSVIEGTVYLPNGNVLINSNATLGETSPYSSLIARTFKINSNSDLVLNSDYEASG